MLDNQSTSHTHCSPYTVLCWLLTMFWESISLQPDSPLALLTTSTDIWTPYQLLTPSQQATLTSQQAAALIPPTTADVVVGTLSDLRNSTETKSSSRGGETNWSVTNECPISSAAPQHQDPFCLPRTSYNLPYLCLTTQRKGWGSVLCVRSVTSIEFLKRLGGKSILPRLRYRQRWSHSGISGQAAPDENGKCGVLLMRNDKLEKTLFLI